MDLEEHTSYSLQLSKGAEMEASGEAVRKGQYPCISDNYLCIVVAEGSIECNLYFNVLFFVVNQ